MRKTGPASRRFERSCTSASSRSARACGARSSKDSAASVTARGFGNELAAESILRAAQLVPDLLVRARKGPRRAVLIFVELDLGTERVGTLVKKVERYDLLRAGFAGYAEAEVVFVVDGEGRRLRLVAQAGGRPLRVVDPGQVGIALTDYSHGMFAPLRRAARTGIRTQVPDLVSVSGLTKKGV